MCPPDILGTAAELHKATVSFFKSVCLSVRAHGTTWLPLDGVRKIWYLNIFPKSFEKVQFSLKFMTIITGSLRKDQYRFILMSGLILRRTRNVSYKSCRENRSNISYWVTYSRKSCRLWANMENRARQTTYDNIIRHIRFECWITKDANTLRICNTYCFSTATVVSRTGQIVEFIRTLPALFLVIWPLYRKGCSPST